MKKTSVYLCAGLLVTAPFLATASADTVSLSECFTTTAKKHEKAMTTALRSQNDLDFAVLLAQRASESFACAGLSLDKAVDDLVSSGDAFKTSKKPQGTIVDNAKAALYLLELEGGPAIAVDRKFLSPDVVERYLKARDALK